MNGWYGNAILPVWKFQHVGGGVYVILNHESMKRNSQRSQNLTKLKTTQAAYNKMVSLQASCIWLWQVFLIIEELLILQFSKIKVPDVKFCPEQICSNSNPSYHISQQLKLRSCTRNPQNFRFRINFLRPTNSVLGEYRL